MFFIFYRLSNYCKFNIKGGINRNVLSVNFKGEPGAPGSVGGAAQIVVAEV